jgi:CRISPR type IV-associated DEAD/DEAH-box helicase Csf4
MIISLFFSDNNLKRLGSKPSKKVKELLVIAKEKGVTPKAGPKGTNKVNVRLNKQQLPLIEQGDEVLSGVEVSRLVVTTLDHLEQQAVLAQKEAYESRLHTERAEITESGIGVNFKADRQWRPQQLAMIPEISLALSSDKVIAVNASTGVGKSAALLASAIIDGRDALIAAPTISIVKHLVKEYQGLDIKHDYTVILGRQNFISESLLMNALNEGNLSDAVKKDVIKWMNDQHDEGVCPVFNLGWLTSHLIESVADLPDGWASGLTIDNTPVDYECPGVKAHQKMIADAKQSKHVFCTHAMIAVDILVRLQQTSDNDIFVKDLKEVLEDYKALIEKQQVGSKKQDDDFKEKKKKLTDRRRELLGSQSAKRGALSTGIFGNRILLVDEAHMLEENIANFLSKKVALSTVIQAVKADAKKNKFDRDANTKKAISQLSVFFNSIIKEGQRQDILYNLNLDAAGDNMNHFFNGFLKQLALYVKHSGTKNDGVLKALDTIKKSLGKTVGFSTYISLSPNYRYPSLLTGRDSIAKPLSLLWGAYPASALLSATMYVPVKGYEFVKRSLYIPESRFVQGRHYESSFNKKNVTVHLPSSKMGPNELSRPSTSDVDLDPQVFSEWLINVAEHISSITAHAEGGTLVLCSSFEIINKLSLFVDEDILERLVIQGGKQDYAQNERQFRESDRPVWLATGRSWQGLDLCSKDNDTLLTDLIIVNLPFGAGSSVSAQKKIEKAGFQNVVPYLTAIKLMQGMGRLVRQEDGTYRHIWILDNRAVNGPKAKMQHFSIPMMQLDGYDVQRDIQPATSAKRHVISMGV